MNTTIHSKLIKGFVMCFTLYYEVNFYAIKYNREKLYLRKLLLIADSLWEQNEKKICPLLLKSVYTCNARSRCLLSKSIVIEHMIRKSENMR